MSIKALSRTIRFDSIVVQHTAFRFYFIVEVFKNDGAGFDSVRLLRNVCAIGFDSMISNLVDFVSIRCADFDDFDSDVTR